MTWSNLQIYENLSWPKTKRKVKRTRHSQHTPIVSNPIPSCSDSCLGGNRTLYLCSDWESNQVQELIHQSTGGDFVIYEIKKSTVVQTCHNLWDKIKTQSPTHYHDFTIWSGTVPFRIVSILKVNQGFLPWSVTGRILTHWLLTSDWMSILYIKFDQNLHHRTYYCRKKLGDSIAWIGYTRVGSSSKKTTLHVHGVASINLAQCVHAQWQ